MGFLELELPCPKTSPVVPSINPEPLWTLDGLLAELDALEQQLGHSSGQLPSPLKQFGCPEFVGVENVGSQARASKPFVMAVSDDGFDDDDSDGEVCCDWGSGAGTRFSCNDLELSESEESDDELQLATRPHLMDKESLEQGILYELEREHQLKVKEQIRSRLSALETYQKSEIERSSSAMLQLEKFMETRREMDRRLDKQYQRKIAQVLDSHLSAIQRDHEQLSQIEERRIRDDAAVEQARREKALYEEKMRQEKAKAEAEARLRAAKMAEEAHRVALEAERRAAAEKEAARLKEMAASELALKQAMEQKRDTNVEITGEIRGREQVSTEGIRVMAADAALKAEATRLKIYDEVALMLHDIQPKGLDKFERQMNKHVKQISGVLENVRTKAHAIVDIINNSGWPHQVSMLIFAKKIVSLCENPSGSFDRNAFACGHVILLVTSQVPAVMDFVLTEFHKACIYTVPKHFLPLGPASLTRDHWKMIGYKEEDGELESSESYLNRVGTYMKLYAALVQTETSNIRNPHGLREGWAWLARFLNALPANRSAACALAAFLKMAGYALYRRYKSQFLKILNVISRSYLPALKERGDRKADEVIVRLEQYLDDNMYQREPEGWRLQTSLDSHFYT